MSNRGLRQGDPLSPFIFVMVMEFSSIHMQLAIVSDRIQPLKRSVQLHISYLLFADDLLVFCRADRSSIKELIALLEKLHLNTDLRVNRDKSKAYLSKSYINKIELATIFRVSSSTLPAKYLEIPLSISYIKSRHFDVKYVCVHENLQ